jgi:hypothetical protein
MSDQVASPARKLGAKPRTFDPTMPHMMSVRMMAGTQPLRPIPENLDLLDGMPDDFGMMLNSQLGCCTASTAYHMGQVWSYHGRDIILTEPDYYVEQLYRESGYDGTPATDQGAVVQEVLRHWLTNGIPIQEGVSETNPAPGRSYLRAAMEVLPRRIEDVKRAIYDCGGVYLGIDVPAWLMQEPELPTHWQLDPRRDNRPVGGHALSGHGYDAWGIDLVSWGKRYRMAWDMFREVTAEAYALIHPWWIESTGRTPFDLSEEQLSGQMSAFCRRHVAEPRKKRR